MFQSNLNHFKVLRIFWWLSDNIVLTWIFHIVPCLTTTPPSAGLKLRHINYFLSSIRLLFLCPPPVWFRSFSTFARHPKMNGIDAASASGHTPLNTTVYGVTSNFIENKEINLIIYWLNFDSAFRIRINSFGAKITFTELDTDKSSRLHYAVKRHYAAPKARRSLIQFTRLCWHIPLDLAALYSLCKC